MFRKDMDSNHETLLFHTSVRCLSKGNILAPVYEIRDELNLFLETRGMGNRISFVHSHQSGFFQVLNNLKLHLQRKNTDWINSYDSIQTFMAKLWFWYRRVQKANVASFPNLDTALDEEQIGLEGELKNEVEAHFLLLK